jgi:hypothetical protein
LARAHSDGNSGLTRTATGTHPGGASELDRDTRLPSSERAGWQRKAWSASPRHGDGAREVFGGLAQPFPEY